MRTKTETIPTHSPTPLPVQQEPTKRSRAAYQAERRTYSYPVAFKDVAEKARFEAMAEEQGYSSFNAYLVQLLRNATSGSVFPPEYVNGLRKEVEKLRAWLDQAREEGTELRADVKTLQAQKETLVFLLNELPEGKQAPAEYQRRHGEARGGGAL